MARTKLSSQFVNRGLAGRQDVRTEELLAEHLADPRVGAASVLVARRRERQVLRGLIRRQGPENRG